MKSMRWIITYVVVASLGLWFAFFMSLRFVSPAYSQTPPAQPTNPVPPQPPGPGSIPQAPTQAPGAAAPQGSASSAPQAPTAGDLPPEFMEEGAAAGAIPPPPKGAPTGPAVQGTDQGNVPVPTAVNPEFAGDDQYNYEPNGRRDPFKPYMTYRTAPGGPVNKADLTDPLQRWDITRFAVMAIIWEVKNPKAMVKDPDGATYMIGKNTKIGRNAGYVVAIREGEVVVVETVDNEGVVTKEVRILELKK